MFRNHKEILNIGSIKSAGQAVSAEGPITFTFFILSPTMGLTGPLF